MTETILLCLGIGFSVGALLGMHSGYRNGAYDAYYFARDPSHPGGRKAGRIIRKGMNHMFGDIPDPDGPQTTGERQSSVSFGGYPFADGWSYEGLAFDAKAKTVRPMFWEEFKSQSSTKPSQTKPMPDDNPETGL